MGSLCPIFAFWRADSLLRIYDIYTISKIFPVNDKLIVHILLHLCVMFVNHLDPARFRRVILQVYLTTILDNLLLVQYKLSANLAN